MRRFFVASVVLSMLFASAAWAQEEESDECKRWSVEVQNSESYDLSVYSFKGNRVPPKVYQRESPRLRGRFLKRVTSRSKETVGLPPGLTMIWLEPVDSQLALGDVGWAESSAIVASPTRRTRITNIRIRTDFTCLDDPE